MGKPFKELGLEENFLKVLEGMKFTESTEIQEKTIPLAIAGKDVIGKSATGSGKTLAFGASIIEKTLAGGGIQALILTPTRELCEQVRKALRDFSKYKDLYVVSVYGGVGINPQIDDLEEADIVVGTPGRVLDHMQRGTIDFSQVKSLVLDEADRMLDMGFRDDVERIIRACPKHRQTFLFSATISNDIAKLSDRYMVHPVEVSVESYVDASKLHQGYYDIPQNEKFSLLVHLLKDEHSKLVMVFCSTKRNADFIGHSLKRYGFDALPLHGDLSQHQRDRAIAEFHKSEKFVLVCTDVAARGLDIKNVSHVYNYDAPKTSEEYIHRVGRTARAGKEGKAITLLCERDYDNFRMILKDKSLKIEKLDTPEFEKVMVKFSGERPRHDHGDRGGRSFGGRGGSSYGGRGRSSGGSSYRGHREESQGRGYRDREVSTNDIHEHKREGRGSDYRGRHGRNQRISHDSESGGERRRFSRFGSSRDSHSEPRSYGRRFR
jgi:ATP-dependent RNA helicase DeaD